MNLPVLLGVSPHLEPVRVAEAPPITAEEFEESVVSASENLEAPPVREVARKGCAPEVAPVIPPDENLEVYSA